MYTDEQIVELKEFAEERSQKTSPFGTNYVSYGASETEWLHQNVFTLYMYCPNIADVLDESNYFAILARLEECDPRTDVGGGDKHGMYWRGGSVSSWVSRIERIEIHPYGLNEYTPFNCEIVAIAQDILNDLENYPILDDDLFSDMEFNWFWESIANELYAYDDDDPIHVIVAEEFDRGHGEYETFLYTDLDKIIKEYEAAKEDAPITGCDNCGEIYNDKELFIVDEGALCEPCFNDSYTVCQACDAYIPNEDIIYFNNDKEWLCIACTNKNHIVACDVCGDYYPLAEMYHQVEGDPQCENCIFTE